MHLYNCWHTFCHRRMTYCWDIASHTCWLQNPLAEHKSADTLLHTVLPQVRMYTRLCNCCPINGKAGLLDILTDSVLPCCWQTCSMAFRWGSYPRIFSGRRIRSTLSYIWRGTRWTPCQQTNPCYHTLRRIFCIIRRWCSTGDTSQRHISYCFRYQACSSSTCTSLSRFHLAHTKVMHRTHLRTAECPERMDRKCLSSCLHTRSYRSSQCSTVDILESTDHRRAGRAHCTLWLLSTARCTHTAVSSKWVEITKLVQCSWSYSLNHSYPLMSLIYFGPRVLPLTFSRRNFCSTSTFSCSIVT